jgi:hypothetical protein
MINEIEGQREELIISYIIIILYITKLKNSFDNIFFFHKYIATYLIKLIQLV